MNRIFAALIISALLPLAMVVGGCSEEVSHTESTKQTWDGGTKHEDTTVYKNADGTTSVEHEKNVNNP